MIYQIMFAIWGCMPELSPGCTDMTNASSTYLGVAIGAIIGGVITWWVYNRQNKTAKMQDEMLNKVADLEHLNIKTLERIEVLDKNHDDTLNKIIYLEQLHIKTLDRIEVLDKNHDATLRSILEMDKNIKRIIEVREKTTNPNNQ